MVLTMKAYKTEHTTTVGNLEKLHIMAYDMKAAAMSQEAFWITSLFDYGNIFSGVSDVYINADASAGVDIYGAEPRR